MFVPIEYCYQNTIRLIESTLCCYWSELLLRVNITAPIPQCPGFNDKLSMELTKVSMELTEVSMDLTEVSMDLTEVSMDLTEVH